MEMAKLRQPNKSTLTGTLDAIPWHSYSFMAFDTQPSIIFTEYGLMIHSITHSSKKNCMLYSTFNHWDIWSIPIRISTSTDLPGTFRQEELGEVVACMCIVKPPALGMAVLGGAWRCLVVRWCHGQDMHGIVMGLLVIIVNWISYKWLYEGFPNNAGSPKWMVKTWKILLTWMISGYPHFRNPPYESL